MNYENDVAATRHQTPPRRGGTQRNTEGYEIRTPHPRGMALTDWAKAWKILENESDERASREWICDNDQWEIWRYRKSEESSNSEQHDARFNDRRAKK